MPPWVNRRLMILSSLPWVGISPPCCKLCWASFLLQQIGGVSLANSTSTWFLYIFFGLALPVGESPRSYFLRALCFCALARYFLVQRSYFVDLYMCMVVYKLKRGNLVGLILVETLNGLDAFHRKESSFFTGSPLLLQV